MLYSDMLSLFDYYELGVDGVSDHDRLMLLAEFVKENHEQGFLDFLTVKEAEEEDEDSAVDEDDLLDDEEEEEETPLPPEPLSGGGRAFYEEIDGSC